MYPKRLCTILIGGLLLLAGCQPAPSLTETAVLTPIRFAITQEPDLSTVPMLLALDALKAQGYPVEITSYAENTLTVEALSSGQADLSTGSPSAYWAAIQQGGQITTLLQYVRNNWVLYTADGIQSCADLAGKRIAVTGEGSAHTAMVRTYMADHCPEVDYELLYIQGSGNRAAALLAGEIDAAPMEFADVTEFENTTPDGYHTLVTFADELPDLVTSALYSNTAFASAHPDVVDAFVQALLAEHQKMLSDPDAFIQQASDKLGVDSAVIGTLVRDLIAKDNWPVDGGLTVDSVQYSIGFYTNSGNLEAGLTASDVADLSYLEKALEP
jgi:NitT/TauT family transport system substrate-binding protein